MVPGVLGVPSAKEILGSVHPRLWIIQVAKGLPVNLMLYSSLTSDNVRIHSKYANKVRLASLAPNDSATRGKTQETETATLEIYSPGTCPEPFTVFYAVGSTCTGPHPAPQAPLSANKRP